MKILQTMLLVGVVQLASLSSAFAGDDLASIKSAGVIKIGTEGTYAPFTYHDESGQLTGFDVEIGQAIAKHIGVKPEFVEGKWDGLIAGLDANRYYAVINEVAITDARRAKYDFSRLAASIAREVVFLSGGSVIESGLSEDIFSRPKQPETASFVSVLNRQG